MTGRYPGWHAKTGDAQASPALRDLGKKLLGEIQNAQRLSGTTHNVRRASLPDGSSVTATISHGVPHLEFSPGPEAGGGKPEVGLLEGFVVRPSPAMDQASNVDKNHVVLRVSGGQDVKPFFHDTVDVPAGLTVPNGLYKAMFPDGIGKFGNLDWRSADERVAVTFAGPESRYFSSVGDDFGTRVFFKGAPIFDLDEVETPLLGLSGGKVWGACLIRGNEGDPYSLYLQVIVHYFSAMQEERWLRFPVKLTALARSILTEAGVGDWRTAASVELAVAAIDDPVRGGEIVASWNRSYDTADSRHPWHFNQSGTEARAIHFDEDARTYREYSVTPDDGLVEVRDDALAVITYAEDTTYTAVPTPLTEHGVTGRQLANFTYNPPIGGIEQAPSYVGLSDDPTTPTDLFYRDINTGDALLAWSGERSTTTSKLWVRAAVDFRNDVPVYAELRVATNEDVGTVSRTIVGDQYYGVTYSGVSYDGSFGGTGLSYTSNAVVDSDSNTLFTASSTKTSVGRGLRTDWAEWAPTSVWAQSFTYEATEDSQIIGAEDFSHGADITWDVDPPVAGTPGTAPMFVDYDEVTAAYSGTLAAEYATTSTRNERDLLIGYLDLRHRFAVIGTLATTTTLNGSHSHSQTLNTLTDYDNAGILAASKPILTNHTVSSNSTTVLELRISRAAIELYSEDIAVRTLSSTPARSAVGITATPKIRGGMFPILMLGPYGNTIYALSHVANTTPPGSAASYASGTTSTFPVETTPEAEVMADTTRSYAGTVMTSDYPNELQFYDHSGAWQVYKNACCFSMGVPVSGAAQWRYGLINTDTGVPHPQTLPVLTGALPTEVRYHPVTILPLTVTKK